jgi:hypothetical protein
MPAKATLQQWPGQRTRPKQKAAEHITHAANRSFFDSFQRSI